MIPLSSLVFLSSLGFSCSSGSDAQEAQQSSQATSKDAPSIQAWSGLTDCCGEDPHPVHISLLAGGAALLVGKSLLENNESRAFAIAVPKGELGTRGLVDEDDNSGYLYRAQGSTLGSAWLQSVVNAEHAYIAGYEKDEDGVPHGTLTCLDARSGKRLWNYVDAPKVSRGTAFESISFNEEGALILGGVEGVTAEGLEGFKSYGNVVNGSGLLIKFSAADLTQTEAPAPAVRSVFQDFISLKSVAALPNSQGIVAIAFNQEEESVLVKLNEDGGLLWIKKPPAGIELTDLTLSGADTPLIVLSGHGGEREINGWALAYDFEGNEQWTTTFGNPGAGAGIFSEGLAVSGQYIFDECWGVTSDTEGHSYLACGTGIEGCDEEVFTSKRQRSECAADPRTIWRSFVLAFDSTGKEIWRRTDFLELEGEATASAAEQLAFGDDGSLSIAIDHDFGVGLLELKLSGSTP